MKKIVLLTTIFLVLLLPDLAQAQGLTQGLCDGTTCSACHLAELANRLINWLIGIVVILFAVLAVWAGFSLVTSGGNPSALQEAKSRFTNAFIGLLIVLSAWLIVDTLMRGIVNGTDGDIAGYGPWSQVQCATQSAATTTPGSLVVDTIELGSFVTSAAEACDPGPSGERVLCGRLEAQCESSGGVARTDTSNPSTNTVSCDRPVGIVDPADTNQACDPGPSGQRVLCARLEQECRSEGGEPTVDMSDSDEYRVICAAASPTGACQTGEMSSMNLFGFNTTVSNSVRGRLESIHAQWQNQSSRYRVYSVGAYNCRRITGGSGYSIHAYGLAVDINPRENPYVKTSARPCPSDMPSSFSGLFTSRGFGWGANWRSVCDAMHFSGARREGGWIDI